MSRVVCRIVLSEGIWENQPSKRAVREALRSAWPPRTHVGSVPPPPTLVRLGFDEPGDDEALVAEAVVDARCCHAETIRDDIVGALLASFQPEYESMVEVEVIE